MISPDFLQCILQSIIYQYYKLKLQCTVYSAALHGCTALHCFLSFQVSLQCDSHFSHDWAPQESLKSSSGDSLGSHRYKRPAKARRPAIWLAYIQAAVGSGPVEHLGAVGIYPWTNFSNHRIFQRSVHSSGFILFHDIAHLLCGEI